MRLTRLEWNYSYKGKDDWVTNFVGGTGRRYCIVESRTTRFGHVRYNWRVIDLQAATLSPRYAGEADTPLAAMLAAEDALLGPLPLRMKWESDGLTWSTAYSGAVIVNVKYNPEVVTIIARAGNYTSQRQFVEAKTIHEAQLWVEEQLLGPLETP